MTFKYEVGDKVVITDPGKAYSFYSEWVVKNAPSMNPCTLRQPKESQTGIVVARAKHGGKYLGGWDTYVDNLNLYLIATIIKDSLQLHSLMTEDGIKLVEKISVRPVSNDFISQDAWYKLRIKYLVSSLMDDLDNPSKQVVQELIEKLENEYL